MEIINGVKAMSKRLGVSRQTVYTWCDLGMPYRQVPNTMKRVFVWEEVMKWLEEGGK